MKEIKKNIVDFLSKKQLVSDLLVSVSFLIVFITTAFINIFVAFYILAAFLLLVSYVILKAR